MVRLSGFLCRLTSWKGELVIVLMGHVSVTISYSSRCLTTETVKYINENSFIENLAASKLGLHDILHAIVMRISSVKTVL